MGLKAYYVYKCDMCEVEKETEYEKQEPDGFNKGKISLKTFGKVQETVTVYKELVLCSDCAQSAAKAVRDIFKLDTQEW